MAAFEHPGHARLPAPRNGRPPAVAQAGRGVKAPRAHGAATFGCWAALLLAAAPARADQPPAFTAGPVHHRSGRGRGTDARRRPVERNARAVRALRVGALRCGRARARTSSTAPVRRSYVPTFRRLRPQPRRPRRSLERRRRGRGPHACERPDPRHARGAARLYPGTDRLLGGFDAGPPAGRRRQSRRRPRRLRVSAPAGARPAYLRPFPVVRIRGYSVPGGVRITLLSVRGPRSSRVRAGCAGPGCPRGPAPVPVAPPARLRAFERFLPAGTFLWVRVTGVAAIGKYTSFRIRARARRDAPTAVSSRAAGRPRAARRPEPALSRSRQTRGPAAPVGSGG